MKRKDPDVPFRVIKLPQTRTKESLESFELAYSGCFTVPYTKKKTISTNQLDVFYLNIIPQNETGDPHLHLSLVHWRLDSLFTLSPVPSTYKAE